MEVGAGGRTTGAFDDRCPERSPGTLISMSNGNSGGSSFCLPSGFRPFFIVVWGASSMTIHYPSGLQRSLGHLINCPHPCTLRYGEAVEPAVECGMAQDGVFSNSFRTVYASLDAKKDRWSRLDAVVPWEEFRRLLSGSGASRADRKPGPGASRWMRFDVKTLVLRRRSTPFRRPDRVFRSRTGCLFMPLFGLGLGDRVPTPRRLCGLYSRMRWRRPAGEELFGVVRRVHLARRGYIAREWADPGCLIRAVPRQSPIRAMKNAAIKRGEVPE